MNYIVARLREPSTYAGLAAILSAFGISFAPHYWEAIMSICIGAAGLAAIVLAEKSA
jgi:hypothetical protein